MIKQNLMKRDDFMPRYVPNMITTMRFFLVPIYVVVFYSSNPNSLLYSTLIFALAGITDLIDGYIARKYDLVTKLGIVLDPLADKLMQLTVLITFTTKNYIPIWAITVIGIKEILMIIGGIILYYGKSDAVIPADKYGKFATIMFYITIFTISFSSKGADSITGSILIAATVVITLIAFINYFIGFTKVNKR